MIAAVNAVTLSGRVVGEPWMRWPADGRSAQVRFWLGVPREGGDVQDVLLCAIQTPTATPAQVAEIERSITHGMSVTLHAVARQTGSGGDEDRPGVIFLAAKIETEDVAWQPRRVHRHGKSAAAGDSYELLDMEEYRP
jgi:hypothetical protein